MACFWACGPLCLPMHSPTPSLTPSPPGHCSNIGEIGPEQRGKNTNRFPNNTFLSTTQTQQGQNEWQWHHFIKVKVPQSFAESRAASCEGSPCPWPRTKWAPQRGADSDRIRWASPEHGSNCMVSACAGLLVAFLLGVQSGQASCPKRIRCSEMSTWKVSLPHPPPPGMGCNSQWGLASSHVTSLAGRVAGLDSPAPPPGQDLGFWDTEKCPR